MNPAVIVVAGIAILYFLSKSKTATPISGIGTAATTSPLGSASGVLTPVATAAEGLLAGLTGAEAFTPLGSVGTGQTPSQISATLSQSAISSEENAGIDYTEGPVQPVTIDTAPEVEDNTLDPSIFTSDSYDINVSPPADISTSDSQDIFDYNS